ncbi:MAG: vWA domain-containing protein, partial [Pseudomonadota bacterium]
MRLRLTLIILLAVSLTVAFSRPAFLGAAFADNLSVKLDRITFNLKKPNWFHLFVSVTDRAGAAVKDLDRANFVVRQDGLSLNGISAAKPFFVTNRRLSFVILLDHSEDMAGSLTLVRNGVKALVEAMGFGYEGTVVSYTGQPRVVAGPTRNAGLLVDRVMSLPASAGRPRLYDGLLFGLNYVKTGLGSDSNLDREVIILLSEGRDAGSQFSLKAVADKIQEAGVNLFLIGYGEDAPDLKLLAGLAQAGGGGAFFSSGPDDMAGLFLTVADRLKYQYILTGQSEAIRWDGRRHRLEVIVKSKLGGGSGQMEFVAPAGPDR